MKKFKFGVSNKILISPPPLNRNKDDGLFVYMIKQARRENPTLFISFINYAFDKDGEEGGSHEWTINMCTLDELKGI